MAVCPFMSNWIFNQSTGEAEFQEKECAQQKCALWDSTNSRCGAFTSDHIINIDNRGKSAPVGYAAILSQEFIQQEDFDGNGKIYGKDFKLKDPPPILKSLEQNSAWKDPDTEWTLDEYKDSLTG